MDPSVDLAIALCALAPIIAAAVAPLLQRIVGWWAGIVLSAVPLAIAWHLSGFLPVIADGGEVRAAIAWVPSYGLTLSFRIDGLSLLFSLMIAGIGALILIYAAAYLKGHPHQGRFTGFMLLFMGAMLGLVLADGLVGIYFFWELTSVASFLLIGFDHARQAARRAAIQALVVTNIGGLALLVGAVVLAQTFGTWDLGELMERAGHLGAHAVYPLVLAMILLAAFTKSAQVPFHFWLPNAMEAPTPVSAYLHSATMVQAGVYLLARTSPMLGDTPAWSAILVGFGGLTLLWGAIGALRQTDLKQMLAQTTLASLGLSVLLLGLGSDAALLAVAVYFAAHAFYKAALFLVAGLIDHGTGTRDITALAGLRAKMPATFAAALVAAISMFGLWPALGFFAKEELYIAADPAGGANLLALVVLVAGNALLSAVALAIALRPFLGSFIPTPHAPHEGPPAMLLGPLLLAGLGIATGWAVASLGQSLFAPAAAAMAGDSVYSHLGEVNLTSLAFVLSVATWVLAVAIYWRLDDIRTVLRRIAPEFTFDGAFDALMFGLIRAAAVVTRLWHHGRLEGYVLMLFSLLGLALTLPLLLGDGVRLPVAIPDLTFYEWGILAFAAAGLLTVLLARTRLFAVIALGVQGVALALLFMLFGAPDLSFTQIMVEILSVVILALVMTRLRLDASDPREVEDLMRDGAVALLCGVGVVAALFAVLDTPFDPRLSAFFIENSVPIAHGHNIVNVILVDFRGIDTLGEIAVVMTAGIAVLALLRARTAGQPPSAEAKPPRARRSRRAKGAPA